MALITIVSDGDPYPALAGIPLTNTAVRQFSGNVIKEQSYNFSFNYRGGTNTINPHVTPVGSIGVALNGVVLYSPRHPGSLPGVAAALLPGSGFEWNAVFNAEAFGADACGGFPESDGSYHYQSGLFLNNGWMGNALVYGSNAYFSDTAFNGDNFRHSDGHSKILGFMFDGYPIYGPYAYTTPLATPSDPGPVRQMLSSYIKKSTAAPGRPYTYTTYAAGTFIQDFEYVPGLGTLDQYNGRFCNTPDFPTGTYAYFLTFENNNINVPSYPYIAGTSTREQRPIGGA
jgi:hypothetical protein